MVLPGANSPGGPDEFLAQPASIRPLEYFSTSHGIATSARILFLKKKDPG